jgi:hypothetical protein
MTFGKEVQGQQKLPGLDVTERGNGDEREFDRVTEKGKWLRRGGSTTLTTE